MEIRKATQADYKSIALALRNKNIPYITPAHALADIENEQLFVMCENGKVIAQCALVHEPMFEYHAMKRMTIYNKANQGRGIAQAFISFFCAMNLPALGCTPWADNAPMQHLLRKFGFEYQYTFLENYQFFKKTT
jgi:RimJ/RimL family protein N-acetyltransferase